MIELELKNWFTDLGCFCLLEKGGECLANCWKGNKKRSGWWYISESSRDHDLLQRIYSVKKFIAALAWRIKDKNSNVHLWMFYKLRTVRPIKQPIVFLTYEDLEVVQLATKKFMPERCLKKPIGTRFCQFSPGSVCKRLELIEFQRTWVMNFDSPHITALFRNKNRPFNC